MKTSLMIILACAALGGAIAPVYAYDAQKPKAEAQKSYTVKGVVVAMDKASSKIKLKHEAVTELEWPAMTMFFSVADKSQLDTVNTGDQVEFDFVKTSSTPLITKIKSIK